MVNFYIILLPLLKILLVNELFLSVFNLNMTWLRLKRCHCLYQKYPEWYIEIEIWLEEYIYLSKSLRSSKRVYYVRLLAFTFARSNHPRYCIENLFDRHKEIWFATWVKPCFNMIKVLHKAHKDWKTTSRQLCPCSLVFDPYW